MTDRKSRLQSGLFAVEGAREIERALTCGYVPTQCFISSKSLGKAGRELLHRIERDGDIDLMHVTAEVFGKLVVREDKDGLLVVFRQKNHDLSNLALPSNPLILAIHGVEKPGNLGALLRSADGAGASAVVVLGGTVDLYNPHVVRGSVGTLFACNIAMCSEEEFKELCHKQNIQIVAAALTDRSVAHFDVDMIQSTALLVGSEAHGLPSHWLSWAHHTVKIPMQGIADSLNVSAAGAVILYEGLRQRAKSSLA